MSSELERRWDDVVETAWREFRQRLADRMAGMAEDEALLVEMYTEADGGAAPYCQILAGPGVLRIEAVSNYYLAPEHQLDKFEEQALVALDFCPPGVTEWGAAEANYHHDLEQRDADRAAVMVVRALREIYAVVHPAWLSAEGLEPRLTPDEPPATDGDQAVTPRSVAEVQAVLDLAITGLYDEAPEWDEDGDLPLPAKRCTVWAIVSSKAPRVLLHCTLLDGVKNLAATMTEVNRLNRAEFGLTFFVADEERVAVTREIGLDAVVPSVLRAEIDRLVGSVDEWAAALSELQKTAATERRIPPKPTRFTTAWSVMVELEREERGSLGPATLARIFENDTGLLIKAIRINEQRRREMRSRVREAQHGGRQGLEKVGRARIEYLRELTSRMRAALRLIVDAPVRKVQLDQLALFDEDDCGTTR